MLNYRLCNSVLFVTALFGALTASASVVVSTSTQTVDMSTLQIVTTKVVSTTNPGCEQDIDNIIGLSPAAQKAFDQSRPLVSDLKVKCITAEANSDYYYGLGSVVKIDLKNQVATFTDDESGYMGGANSFTNHTTYMYDLQTGQKFTLFDLLKDKNDFLKRVKCELKKNFEFDPLAERDYRVTEAQYINQANNMIMDIDQVSGVDLSAGKACDTCYGSEVYLFMSYPQATKYFQARALSLMYDNDVINNPGTYVSDDCF